MKRNVDMSEISDGKLYTANDMVKAGCDGCKGCFVCCTGMGDTVILDPLDVYRLTSYIGCGFEQLLASKVALGVVDGIISLVRNLKIQSTGKEMTMITALCHVMKIFEED